MAPIIEFTGIGKTFTSGRKKIPALRNLSLSVRQGEIFGFIGPNGAGKSTTIKILLKFIRPTAGTLQLFGHDIRAREFRTRIGYLPEFPCFYNQLTAVETLEFAGRLSDVPAAEIKARIPGLLARAKLSASGHHQVGSFSKGMKQRLGMAAALIHDPEVFVLDEPMSGLDPVGRYQMKELITDLHRRGKTVFFSSHILGDIEELCERIGVIHQGNLLYQGGIAAFTRTEPLEKSFLAAIEEWNRTHG